MHEDINEDDLLETLAAENDEDVILVMQFEDSISETIQSDAELAAYYSSYQDARRRLNERVRVRGFWPVTKRFEKGGGKKGKVKGKGKGPFSGGGSLARRIANSFCRICMQKGHWKNECPQRPNANASNPSGSSAAHVAPTSVVTTEDVPPEIAHFTMVDAKDMDHVQEHPCCSVSADSKQGSNQGDKWGKIIGDKKDFVRRFHLQWKKTRRTMKSSDAQPAPLPDPKQLPLVLPSADESASTSQTCDVNFATSGTLGIVDLGASQTVIGDAQVKDLVQNLPEEVQQQIQRTSCHLTFRFGNQQTLTSRHALLLPLGRAKFRIAVVPGRTPFLLSSSFLKGIKAVIDTDNGTMWSKTLNRELAITQSNKNLFLMDISQLWPTMPSNQQVQKSDATGFACQPVPIQNQAVAVWETSLDMSNMKHDDTVSH